MNTTVQTHKRNLSINTISGGYAAFIFIYLFAQLISKGFSDLGVMVSMYLASVVSVYFHFNIIKSKLNRVNEIISTPSESIKIIAFLAICLASTFVFTLYYTLLIAPVLFGVYVLLAEMVEKSPVRFIIHTAFLVLFIIISTLFAANIVSALLVGFVIYILFMKIMKFIAKQL